MLRSLKVQSNTTPERSQLVFVETHNANFCCVLRIMIKEFVTLIVTSLVRFILFLTISHNIKLIKSFLLEYASRCNLG
jgi:hypothetical protein